MKSRQLSLGNSSESFNQYWNDTKRKFHGGSHSIGKRKTTRPLDTKKPIHVVLGSKRAKSQFSLRSPINKVKVDTIVHNYAARFGVRIYDYSNNGDHLHLCIKTASRDGFQRYLKTISGLIARIVLKAKKGTPKGKFWDALAFTRVADWGKSFSSVRRYIFRNVLEASGLVPYDRKNLKFFSIDSA